MASRHREEVINTQLAVLLSRYGVRADAESILNRGAERPDVLFELQGLRVVIEGKYDDFPSARQALEKQTATRVSRGIAHIAVAVVYPRKLRSVATADLLERLKESLVTFRIVTETGETDWHEADPAGLMNALRRAQETLADDDIVARTAESLHQRLIGVTALWLGQSGVCDRLSNILGMPIAKGESGENAESRRGTAAKVSALVIANALVFQEQLATTDGRITPLRKLDHETDVVSASRTHWRWIWENINYVPIFQLGERVLAELPLSNNSGQAFRALLSEAREICTQQSALRHDLMGRIYHWLLHDAKYLGTYYTSVSAATLLLKLVLGLEWGRDFGDPPTLASFKIADLACGTGTLLMAAAQAISDAYIRSRADTGRTLTPVDLHTLHRAIMENILYGYDVLPSAVHLTASTLAMLAPEVAFVRMNLYVMPIGVFGKEPRLGSLDFLNDNNVPTQFSLDDSHAEAMRTGAGAAYLTNATLPEIDLCVMNPPFVRSVGGNLLFGSMPDDRGELQAELKRRVKSIKASSTAGLGAVFVALADKRLRRGGRLAFVLPHALCSGEAWAQTRELIAAGYDLEMVIVSHDAQRPNFSENTDLSELMFIACKRESSAGVASETRYVSLWKNPTSIHAALDLADRIQATPHGVIRSPTASRGEVFDLPRPKGTENWFGALFAAGELARAFMSLRDGTLSLADQPPRTIPMCRLDAIGELGFDRRDVHDAFTVIKDAPSSYPAFWDHDAKAVRTIQQQPNAWLHARSEPAKGRPLRDAQQIWSKAADVLLVERLWSITHRIVAAGLQQPVLGNTWWALSTTLTIAQRKALLLWLNGTIAILLFFGNRVVTRGPWVQMKKPAWAAMPVLDVRTLDATALQALADAYDRLATQNLKPLAQLADDAVRAEIDAALAAVLGLSNLAPLRELLGREPGLTGKPYLRTASATQTSLSESGEKKTQTEIV